MIRITVIFCFVIALCCGCSSTGDIFTVRMRDIENQHYYSARDTFKSDETPAVVISGQAGHDVTVQLRKCDIDFLIRTQTFYIKQGELKWVVWKGLPPGDYIAELVVQDETNAVNPFMIEPSADQNK